MLKRVLSLMLGIMFLLSPAVLAATSFSDVTASYGWAQEAISDLAKSKVINGYPDGTFKPGNSITKEEAISLCPYDGLQRKNECLGCFPFQRPV